MSTEVSTKNTGTSAEFVLFVVFLVLKLCGVIAWSWVWVTAPLWVPAAFVALVIAVLFVFALASRR